MTLVLCYIITNVIPKGTISDSKVLCANKDVINNDVLQIVDNQIDVVLHTLTLTIRILPQFFNLKLVQSLIVGPLSPSP